MFFLFLLLDSTFPTSDETDTERVLKMVTMDTELHILVPKMVGNGRFLGNGRLAAAGRLRGLMLPVLRGWWEGILFIGRLCRQLSHINPTKTEDARKWLLVFRQGKMVKNSFVRKVTGAASLCRLPLCRPTVHMYSKEDCLSFCNDMRENIFVIWKVQWLIFTRRRGENRSWPVRRNHPTSPKICITCERWNFVVVACLRMFLRKIIKNVLFGE